MNDKNQDSTPESVVTPVAQPVVKSPSRRRLIKLGTAGVPVVATLASSPAMAWHCRTASAWGSNMDGNNLTASQKANDGHDSVVDECWSVSDWCNNTARSVKNGINGKPWDSLNTTVCGGKLYSDSRFKNLPAKDPETKKTITSDNKHQFLKMSELRDKCGIVLPAGANANDRAFVLMSGGTAFLRTIIVAQLNYKFPNQANSIQWCAKEAGGGNVLTKMATGSFKPSGSTETWNPTKIADYLQKNYMAL